ncbi:MAG: type 4a pilus biogenesis protein PilO [Candidatus Eremiobacteraeota bacterium]|nr:type 4a pilus biogenesis protein PilO [Candidatus Eremiobacteraeota bacterium]
MNQQPNRVNRILVVAGVLVLVMIIAYFSLIQGKLNQVAASRAQLASLQTQYDDLKRVADQKPLYLSLIRQVQSRLNGVELTADPRAYIPSYLKQIEDLAKRDGLIVTSVVPAPAPTPSGSPTPGPGASPSSVTNIPVIGQPLKQAGKALNASNAVTAQTNNVSAQTNPVANAGATPVPVPSGGVAPSSAVASANAHPNSPRANAIVYLNQSFSQVPVNMELSGNYAQLQKFLRDLNRFPKLIGVGNVTITAQEHVVGETPKLHIVLPITAYRLSPSGPVSQATAAPAGNGG